MFRILTLLILLFAFQCYTSKDKVDKSYVIPLMKSAGNDSKIIQVNVIGDSLSERSSAFGLQNKLGSGYNVNDFSVSGRTVLDWLFDISHPFTIVPDVMIIELGTNDAMTNSNYDFKTYFDRLLLEIQSRSGARIILTAIPLTDDLGLHEKIRTNNSYILSFSNQYTVVNLEKVFEDNQTNLRLYPTYDPIHPNPSAYELIGEVYKKEILYYPDF